MQQRIGCLGRSAVEQDQAAAKLCELEAKATSPSPRIFLLAPHDVQSRITPVSFQVYLACGIIILSPRLGWDSFLGVLSSHGFADPAVYTIWADTRNKTRKI
jgi:hypothetical protein